MITKKILFIIFTIIFICTLIYLGIYFVNRSKSESESQKISKLYNENLPNNYKFKYLLELNPDIKGWISIENTQINYPVVQSNDNEYYLHRNIYKNYDISGTPFIDYRNEFTNDSQSNNLVIYGHHMNFDGKFGILLKYKDLNFYKQHPIIKFDTIYTNTYKDIKWKVLAGFYVSAKQNQSQASKFDYQNYLKFETQDKYNDFINQVKSRSIIQTNVDTKCEDNFITLSTCANEFKDGRFIVIARQVRESESDSANISDAVYNPSPIYPDEWHP